MYDQAQICFSFPLSQATILINKTPSLFSYNFVTFYYVASLYYIPNPANVCTLSQLSSALYDIFRIY